MVSRVVLLLFVLDALNVFWVLEQPVGSALQRHPRMQQLIATRKVFKYVTHMWKFGSASSKPTMLLSSRPWIEVLEVYRTVDVKPAPKLTLMNYHRCRSRVKWTGNKRALKMSQEYPNAFGDAVLLVWRMHRNEIENEIQSRRVKMRRYTTDLDWCANMQWIMMGAFSPGWADAELWAAFHFLVPEAHPAVCSS